MAKCEELLKKSQLLTEQIAELTIIHNHDKIPPTCLEGDNTANSIFL
ncbi:hypothetical protein FDUTEX481_04019 [Tolypothrix sp. PCC 7601]|nr:hypothetical protein FDUTEX481_04019 [Tolypothrix sp. PCC 7601]